ncbi:MAG: 4Fe-4S binding protein [Firmicutes bacterium]|nr:4Fe-4S binding protein [Bacillota bacterium]
MNEKSVVKYTLDSCEKCMKCIKACPTSALSMVDNRIIIDGDLCINCGRCIRACHSKGLLAEGSPLTAIDDYDYTVCLVPAALSSQCGSMEKAEEMFANIKDLGFDEVIDISDIEGAIMNETFRLADDISKESVITSFCPVVVQLIETKYPMLIDHFAPLRYASELAAMMVREQLSEREVGGGTVGIFYLCECEAKLVLAKHPYDNPNREVDHAIAIVDILPLIQKKNPNSERPKLEFSRAGLQSCNTALIPQKPEYLMADGSEKVENILDLAEFDLLKSFRLLYLFNCFNGCVGGHLMFGNGYLAKNNIHALSPKDVKEPPELPFELLYCEDVIVEKKSQVSVAEKMAFFKKVNEVLEQLPGLDCSACGMQTCRVMAESIIKGERKLDDCRILSAKEKSNDAE